MKKIENNSMKKELLLPGFKKSPYLFIFCIFIILLGTAIFLMIPPLGWIILGGFYEAFISGSIFQKIISSIFIAYYTTAVLHLADAFTDI